MFGVTFGVWEFRANDVSKWCDRISIEVVLLHPYGLQLSNWRVSQVFNLLGDSFAFRDEAKLSCSDLLIHSVIVATGVDIFTEGFVEQIFQLKAQRSFFAELWYIDFEWRSFVLLALRIPCFTYTFTLYSTNWCSVHLNRDLRSPKQSALGYAE